MNPTEECVRFLRRLLRTPSPPGEEGEAAELVRAEMEELGYDEVRVDEVGNVIGRVRGRDEAPPLTFLAHLDHVAAGDPADWPHPPFGGEVADGRVWGRGAVDIKGPLAAQVHGVARAAAAEELPGDAYVAAVVQEEVGGLGARWLAGRLRTELVVVGEPSGNRLRRGHRGRVELEATFRGRSAHASAPERGVNPLESAAAFLLALRDLHLPAHRELGRSTLVPTAVRTEPESRNVIPSHAVITCDCRTVPGQEAEDVRRLLEEAVDRSLRGGAEARVEVPSYSRRSWTGHEESLPADNPAWLLPEDHVAVRTAAGVLGEALGRAPEVGLWKFATDGGHFVHEGATAVGVGPGAEELAHTAEESIAVDELEEALRVNGALARAWPVRYAAEA